MRSWQRAPAAAASRSRRWPWRWRPAADTGAGLTGRDGTGACAVGGRVRGAGPAAGAADWPTYHGSPRGRACRGRCRRRAGAEARPGAQARRRGLRLTDRGRRPHVVATENDSVYAFDRTTARCGSELSARRRRAERAPCGNIDPLGITGTPIRRGDGQCTSSPSTAATSATR